MDVDLSHIPLMLDVSGDPETPVPTAMPGEQCACCGLWTQKLWQGARSGFTASHAVCTLCYLAGHLDSPTAAHGVLAYLPGMAMTDVHHLQRRALIAILGGTRTQRAQGKRVLLWLARHGREVEQAWGTTRAGEFAMAFQRLPPHKRSTFRNPPGRLCPDPAGGHVRGSVAITAHRQNGRGGTFLPQLGHLHTE
ncbi:conjugal transfer protein TraT [Pseudomonas syringae group genomosp. 3]|uniref:conjugal transfer protein TraT n=1 Tax=Pseudomonas syringae group genomosp. 3 TaxID=251701 RepID=UPI000AB092AB|nr:conjugal transfer protein TraT [Pseudomonas syringae group genomosp. 3]